MINIWRNSTQFKPLHRHALQAVERATQAQARLQRSMRKLQREGRRGAGKKEGRTEKERVSGPRGACARRKLSRWGQVGGGEGVWVVCLIMKWRRYVNGIIDASLMPELRADDSQWSHTCPHQEASLGCRGHNATS